jgi:hypothetical protein
MGATFTAVCILEVVAPPISRGVVMFLFFISFATVIVRIRIRIKIKIKIKDGFK